MAKTETTVKGYVYTVTSPNGGTVTDAEGKLNKPVDAGDQVTVTAPSDALTCDDDEAVICKANFNHALAALGLLGEGEKSDLPAGYLRLLALQGTGTTSYIDTQVVVGEATGAYWKHLVPKGKGNEQGFSIFYAESPGNVFFGAPIYRNLDSGYAFNSAYKSIGNNLGGAIAQGWLNFRNDKKVRLIAEDGFWFEDDAIYGGDKDKVAVRLGWGANKYNLWTSFIYEAQITQGEALIRDYVPALAPSGEPCMYDNVTRAPFANGGSKPFIAVFALAQARKLGKHLPAGGGTMTISLPPDYEQDFAVAESMETAQAKGWTLTVQTYEADTGAAATFGMRRIWVRRKQDESGSYVAADGSRWQVEWCVDVIGADPESLGYERFRSVDAAVAYWELVPYVDPEAMDEAMGDNGTLEQGGTSNTSPETIS